MSESKSLAGSSVVDFRVVITCVIGEVGLDYVQRQLKKSVVNIPLFETEVFILVLSGFFEYLDFYSLFQIG